ncbi:MAG: hypothetical protein ACTHOK_09095 [Nocardioidaceae bacterium]
MPLARPEQVRQEFHGRAEPVDDRVARLEVAHQQRPGAGDGRVVGQAADAGRFGGQPVALGVELFGP